MAGLKEEFMEFVDSPDDNFETFCFCLGSGDSLFKNKISEYDLMRAWLHPELIEGGFLRSKKQHMDETTELEGLKWKIKLKKCYYTKKS